MAVSRTIRRLHAPRVQPEPRGWLIRRTARAAVTLYLLTVFTAALSGCESEPTREPQTSAPTLSVEEYVAHMSALAVAVEEGLSGEPAAVRALELGGGGHTREEVERFTDAMSRRPEIWADVEAEVVERIREIRRTEGDG